MDVFEITYQTRPESVEVFSKTARAQVTRLIAALAHHEQDNDDISRARVSEAQFGLIRVMELDEAVKNFRAELDKSRRVVQDRFYDLEDSLQRITPAGLSYRVQTKGSTNVGTQGQAKLPRPTSSTSISAGGNPAAIGDVLAPSTGAAKPVIRAETSR